MTRVLVDTGWFLNSTYFMLRGPSSNTKVVNREDYIDVLKNSIQSNVELFTCHEVILCLDDEEGYWREEIFPEYKHTRKATKKKQSKEGSLNLDEMYECFNAGIERLKQHPEYMYIKVPKAEADDIMAALVMNRDAVVGEEAEDVIISSDHDLITLSRYGAKIYNPANHKGFVECANPGKYLLKQIIQGCGGDDIPSIQPGYLGPTRTERLVEKGGAKLREAIKNHAEAYARNRRLIHPEEIPDEIIRATIDEYSKQLKTKTSKRSNLNSYVEELY